MPEAVAHKAWAEVGVLAHPQPTQHRPGTSSNASEGEVPLSGRPYRAVVGHSSAQDKRHQQRLERDRQTSQSLLQTAARTAAPRRASRLPSRGRHGGGTAHLWPGAATLPHAAHEQHDAR